MLKCTKPTNLLHKVKAQNSRKMQGTREPPGENRKRIGIYIHRTSCKNVHLQQQTTREGTR
jgi:hypothetical protein